MWVKGRRTNPEIFISKKIEMTFYFHFTAKHYLVLLSNINHQKILDVW